MEHTLIAFLVVNVVLVAGTAGSILYASADPYPYLSSYALTYSYAHPPLVLTSPLELDVAAYPRPLAVETSLENISADSKESLQFADKLSTHKSSTPLVEAAPSSAPSSHVQLSPLPEAAALGEPAPASQHSTSSHSPVLNELKYYHLSLPVTYTIPTPLTWPTASQFHEQDGLGQYNYAYANEYSAKQEFKLLDGITRGAYNYIDAEGQLQTVSYVSDGDGFRVAATNLPQPAVSVEIPDSPEVAAAKAAHLQAKSEAVANVNRANAADAIASGDSLVRGCNETSENCTPTHK